MMKPSIFDIKYNGLDMYEAMRQVDRDRMLYDMAYKTPTQQTVSSTYVPETKSDRFLRYYNNIDIYIEANCSDKDWKQIKKAKNINPYKKEYARLVADEFDYLYRGHRTLSETQICIIILIGLITICCIPFNISYVILGILLDIVLLVLFKFNIYIHNNRVQQKLSQIAKSKMQLIEKMKGSK